MVGPPVRPTIPLRRYTISQRKLRARRRADPAFPRQCKRPSAVRGPVTSFEHFSCQSASGVNRRCTTPRRPRAHEPGSRCAARRPRGRARDRSTPRRDSLTHRMDRGRVARSSVVLRDRTRVKERQTVPAPTAEFGTQIKRRRAANQLLGQRRRLDQEEPMVVARANSIVVRSYIASVGEMSSSTGCGRFADDRARADARLGRRGHGRRRRNCT